MACSHLFFCAPSLVCGIEPFIYIHVKRLSSRIIRGSSDRGF